METEEFVVVVTQIVGNAEHWQFDSREIERRPSLYSATRAGLAILDHDDFNIAVLVGGKLARWTWMGEETEPPTTHDELVDIAERLDWEVAALAPK